MPSHLLPVARAVASALALHAVAAPASAASDPLRQFLAQHRCDVVDRLTRIHAMPDPADEQDRFLILSRADAPQDYVQCAFYARDRRMLCEAASGFFYDVPRTMHLTPAAIAALGRLGFSTDDAEPRNFHQSFALADPPDLAAVADLMLTALFVGYDARAATALTLEAPDAPQPTARCAAIG